MSSRPSPQGRFCHPQVHTWKHHQTGLRDLPWDGDSSSSPWDTKCQPRPVPELAADHVRGWAFSALAGWRFAGEVYIVGAALCITADAVAFLGSTCQVPATTG